MTFSSTKLATLALLLSSTSALDNGLGMTPQMGWNTWNKFACDIQEDLIKQTADKLVDLGLVELGYKYLNLDDCWQQEERTRDGHVQVSEKFPSGMKALAEYIHSKNMLFGLYSSAGTHTCAGRAGGLDYEVIDAQDYASWGVDYLKYDNCFNQHRPAIERYTAMRDALNQTGRQIFYSICNWGDEDTPSWAPSVGNSWRTTQDIKSLWGSIEFNFQWNLKAKSASGPGGWNDPDMLEVGVGGLNLEEEKTHFALWAVSKAPLIIGADLTTISAESLAILKNKALIGINQDPESPQAKCVLGCSYLSRFLRKPSVLATKSNQEVVLVIVNWREMAYNGLTFSLKDLMPNLPDGPIQVTDLYTDEMFVWHVEEIDSIKIDSLPPHGSFVYKLSPVHNELAASADMLLI